jgi:hypothetical protein
MALISALITCVGLYQSGDLIAKIHRTPPVVFFSATMAIVLTASWLGWGRWGSISGYRTFFKYPPTWVAVSLGLLFVSVAFSKLDVLAAAFLKIPQEHLSFQCSFAKFNWIVIGTSLGLVGIAMVALARANGRPGWAGTKPTGLTVGELSSWRLPNPPTWEGWGKWLKDDRPVENPESDIFRHQHIAQRIVKRLLSTENAPPQAVIGGLGAGKSSIGKLVAWELENQNLDSRIKFIIVGLWEYENARAAVHGLINELVKALEKEVAAFGISELPSQYLEAMTAAGGVWSSIPKLLGWSSRPLDALKQIDKIASSINIKFVLWIEDLERYAGLAGKDKVQLNSSEFERVGPIRAMIDSLNKLKSVSMVLATTKPSDQMDLEKLALYVEEIPSLDLVKVQKALGTFRRAAFSRFPTLIDPSAGEGRADLDMLEQEYTSLFTNQLSDGKFYFMSQALPLLCRNPRILKQSLRKCFEFWDTNPGEIDFDALMVGSILFYFDRNVFNYMRSNDRKWLGKSQDSFFSSRADDPSTAFLKELGYDEYFTKALQRAFYFLLGSDGSKTRLQGFSQSHGTTRYWERFLACPHIPQNDSDQALLAVLENGDREKLLVKLEGDQASSVEHFSKLLDHGVVRSLLLDLVERRKGDRVSKWITGESMGARDHAPGLIPIWRIWLSRRNHSGFKKEAIATLREAIDLAIPNNLALAFDLEYFFVTADSQNGNNFLDWEERDQIPDLKAFFRDRLVHTYQDNPDLLIARLEGVPNQYLWWLCWGLDVVRKGQFEGLPFPQWSTFKTVILRSLENAPELMALHVARLVLNYTSTFGGEKYSYNLQLDESLFDGIARQRIMALVTRESPLWDDPLLNALMEFPRTTLKQLPESELPMEDTPN